MNVSQYFSSFGQGLWSLMVGMGTTLKIFFRKKTTECYPDNRKEVYISPRFRGKLSMLVDKDGNHKCIACGLCQMNCPNNTITVHSKTENNAEGKPKKVLTKYEYDLGCCLFCQICVRVCPTGAIEFVPDYENSVFTRSKLILSLNPIASNGHARSNEGSNDGSDKTGSDETAKTETTKTETSKDTAI